MINSLIVLEALIDGFKVQRIYADEGSSFVIMYENSFKCFIAHTRSRLRKSHAPLIGFLGEVYDPQGLVDLRVRMRESGRSKTILFEFAILEFHSLYNVIIGRTGMRSLGAVRSTIHSMIKFLTASGVANLKTSKEALREKEY
nr:reverse transcriptase domain-containing protein [Tanacetum cinerariifolium]